MRVPVNVLKVIKKSDNEWIDGRKQTHKQTWLDKSDIKNFIHLTIVGGYMEHTLGWILYARYIDRNQIFGNLLPFDSSSPTGWNVKYLRP